jgi:hypothetical protein
MISKFSLADWSGLKGNDADGQLRSQTAGAVINTAAQSATDFAKNNPGLTSAIAVNAIASGTTPKSDFDKFIDSTSSTINNAAGALDQTIKQAAENDNYRDKHSDDPVERAFNGIVALGTPVLQAIDATGNHIVAITDAGKQLSQDPHLLDTIGYGINGTGESIQDSALNTVTGWVWTRS